MRNNNNENWLIEKTHRLLSQRLVSVIVHNFVTNSSFLFFTFEAQYENVIKTAFYSIFSYGKNFTYSF